MNDISNDGFRSHNIDNLYKTVNDKKKTELLKELATLGELPNGRKQRSDKGKSRGPNSKVRRDKGQSRISTKYMQQSPLSIFKRELSRLTSIEVTDSDDPRCIRTDVNGIYLLRMRDTTTKGGNYTVHHANKAIARTIKYIQGSVIDLERYRFEALQNEARNEIINANDAQYFKEALHHTNSQTWFDLFVKLYHIKDEEALRWTYDKWRKEYDILYNWFDEEPIPDTFVLEINKELGTNNYHSEMSSSIFNVKVNKIAELKNSKEYVNFVAKVRDREVYAKSMAIKRELLLSPATCDLSLYQIDRLVDKELNEKYIIEINNIVARESDAYIKEKLENE